MTAYIKSGALLPELELEVSKKDPDTGIVSPVDLSLATSVSVDMWFQKDKDTLIQINGEVTDVDFASGVGKYEWQPGDTDEPGEYNVEVHVTWPDGRLEVFPTRGVGTVHIGVSYVSYTS